MPRAFTAADITQHVAGTDTAAATPSLAFPAGATAGRAGVIVLTSQGQLDPPEQWGTAGAAATTTPEFPQLLILVRPDLPAGETTWTFTQNAGTSGNWCWVVEEWDNLSFTPLAARTPFGGASFQPASVSTGNSDTFTAPYVVGIAAIAILSTGGPGWPSVSWSNSFTETDVQQVGDGTANGDLQLRVARRYGTLNETGPWETTATFTGSMTSKNVYACLAVFRTENYAGDI